MHNFILLHSIMSNKYAIIMQVVLARVFGQWAPTQHPKQFLDVLGTGETLIQQTLHVF